MHELVKDYYGRQLQGTADLRTSACCDASQMPEWLKPLLARIHPEVMSRYYGCGLVCPPLLEGCRVLDLGCGSGRDVYVLSQLVGETGQVVGVDMTEEQLAVAERYRDHHRQAFGLSRDNVEFHLGYIEHLDALDLEDASFDVVVSNCVVNLSPDKETVLQHVHRLLKPGGELYFSDVFAGRRVPERFHGDPVLRGECLAGAMYTEDFRRMLRRVGCLDYRTMSSRRIALDSPEIETAIGMIDFHSVTVRAFKLDLEDICEDYGQIAIYRGTIPDWPHWFDLDDHHRLHTGKPLLVCGNTAAMLQETRYAPHFEIIGDRSVHYGPFDCGSNTENATLEGSREGACC